MKNYKHALVLLRRDIRLIDNTALNYALKNAEKVTIGFIFNPKQADKAQNEYFSANAFQFLCESLTELDEELQKLGSRLAVWRGDTAEVVTNSIFDFDLLYFNEDYTPFAKKRDEKIKKIVKNKGKEVKTFHDVLLTMPGAVKTGGGTPYKVFTPFKRAAMAQVPVPKPETETDLFEKKVNQDVKSEFLLEDYFKKYPYEKNKEIFVHGGRSNALKRFENLKKYKNYDEERNFPAINQTSGLSAAHKFGVVSVRETYWRIRELFGVDHTLISELYWRDFYSLVGDSWPEVFGLEFKEKYRKVIWEDLKLGKNEVNLEKWKRGETGFPIVDAGMRQLNQTGWMHNRVRMVVACFLVKDLQIDWREGEKYFAQQLVDYDPAVNNGSWQWAASTGTDAQPYFRIFNPWSQQKRFDPQAEYVKRWIPELKELSAKEIHNWKGNLLVEYPPPMVEHKTEVAKATKMFLGL